jgi:hypothetical protein
MLLMCHVNTIDVVHIVVFKVVQDGCFCLMFTLKYKFKIVCSFCL